ncbi:uncharacterized protein TrAtP1_011804 [Trichoderma atroviride]|uniref:Uncharacterized protein n=1 Tax=Hypocrea atroviridis (strain ATCC 20476 / IMI 206040) TaxID=452589 RepID=G9P5F9_HYPAI|nr:uncharacterized protein TRIATDRAFT_322230 [Trichoderma atroviride IMI 206040]EHK42130.1 hypothetical protein TRIATDRAFT_322230 [Trichoderma atroviride IMI 206040]UKZ70835.1 hypothetical protein TrAtP1_011804 [Trichoderma atroviride]
MSNGIAKRQRTKGSSASVLQSLAESENTTMKWQDSPEGLSPDWIFSNNSNVHVCNDRKWFTELTTFPSTALGPLASQGVPVSGVGVVNLPVKRSPDSRGPDAHHVLRLTDVLYMPSSVCNIVGSPIFEIAAQVSLGATENSMGGMNDASGKPVAYFSPHSERNCLRLSGPPVGPRLGPSKFKPDTAYWLTIKWPASERARWEAHGQQTKADTEKHQWVGEQPYTTEEKQWLKKHYGGEFKFLMAYELSIYNEEDRAEGRAIMRTLARDDDSTDDNDEDDEMEAADEEEDEEDEEDSDLEGHLADYHFNEEELDWIKKHYGNSANFMISYGFKFYDDQDCAAARGLVKDFLRE